MTDQKSRKDSVSQDTRKHDIPYPQLNKSDFKEGQKPSDLTSIQKGKQLARLIYFEGHSQKSAVRTVFPDLNEHSAITNSTKILATHNVLQHLFDMLPDKIDPNEYEHLFHYLKNKALKTNNDDLLFRLFDRVGKSSGKFNEDIHVTISRDQEQVNRVEKAKKLLEKAGIDAEKLAKEG